MSYDNLKARFPFLDGSATVDEWRVAKRIVDSVDTPDSKRREMYDAFGCHGEPIADAIEQALAKIVGLTPEHSRQRAAAEAILLEAYSTIGDIMTDVRSELDERLQRYVDEQRQDARGCVGGICGRDLQASDYGVDISMTLEDAFESGVDAVASYFEDSYDEGGTHTLDDL
jgi:hypothetical protein